MLWFFLGAGSLKTEVYALLVDCVCWDYNMQQFNTFSHGKWYMNGEKPKSEWVFWSNNAKSQFDFQILPISTLVSFLLHYHEVICKQIISVLGGKPRLNIFPECSNYGNGNIFTYIHSKNALLGLCHIIGLMLRRFCLLCWKAYSNEMTLNIQLCLISNPDLRSTCICSVIIMQRLLWIPICRSYWYCWDTELFVESIEAGQETV